MAAKILIDIGRGVRDPKDPHDEEGEIEPEGTIGKPQQRAGFFLPEPGEGVAEAIGRRG